MDAELSIDGENMRKSNNYLNNSFNGRFLLNFKFSLSNFKVVIDFRGNFTIFLENFYKKFYVLEKKISLIKY